MERRAKKGQKREKRKKKEYKFKRKREGYEECVNGRGTEE